MQSNMVFLKFHPIQPQVNLKTMDSPPPNCFIVRREWNTVCNLLPYFSLYISLQIIMNLDLNGKYCKCLCARLIFTKSLKLKFSALWLCRVFFWKSETFTSGGSRISPRRGRQLSWGGHQHMIFPHFPEICMKSKEFGSLGRGTSLRPTPLDPPMVTVADEGFPTDGTDSAFCQSFCKIPMKMRMRRYWFVGGGGGGCRALIGP